MSWITDPQAWIAFATLLVLEVVLGIDNIVFLTILASKLPAAQQAKARIVGLGLAMFLRIALLVSISWVIGLTAPLFTVLSQEISGRDIILIGGGLFLIAKATLEIHDSLEGVAAEGHAVRGASFLSVLVQIALIDIVFSLDSVITAVGLADDIAVMVIAIVIAVGVMMFSAGAIGRFVDDHPTIKMLALSFLVLIGVALIAEGIELHIPKGYIYFAMAFSMLVEMLNMRIRRARQPVHLHRKGPQ